MKMKKENDQKWEKHEKGGKKWKRKIQAVEEQSSEKKRKKFETPKRDKHSGFLSKVKPSVWTASDASMSLRQTSSKEPVPERQLSLTVSSKIAKLKEKKMKKAKEKRNNQEVEMNREGVEGKKKKRQVRDEERTEKKGKKKNRQMRGEERTEKKGKKSVKDTDVSNNFVSHATSVQMVPSSERHNVLKQGLKMGNDMLKPGENPVCETNTDSEKTVFVGNLPHNIGKKRLKKMFLRYGVVEAVRLRSAPVVNLTTTKKVAVIKRLFHPQRTNINAYIRFSTAEDAQKALMANGELVDSHHIRVDGAAVSTRDAQCRKRAVFIGNVPFDAEEESVRTLFQECGKIVDVRIIRDKKTGMGKGFAYVTFDNIDGVELALQLSSAKLGNRELRIFRAATKEKAEKMRLKRMPRMRVKVLQAKRMDKRTSQKEEKFLFRGKKSQSNLAVEQLEKYSQGERTDAKQFQGERADHVLRKKNSNKFQREGKTFIRQDRKYLNLHSGGQNKFARSHPKRSFQGEQTDGGGRMIKKRPQMDKNVLKKLIIAKKLQQ